MKKYLVIKDSEAEYVWDNINKKMYIVEDNNMAELKNIISIDSFLKFHPYAELSNEIDDIPKAIEEEE